MSCSGCGECLSVRRKKPGARSERTPGRRLLHYLGIGGRDKARGCANESACRLDIETAPAGGVISSGGGRVIAIIASGDIVEREAACIGIERRRGETQTVVIRGLQASPGTDEQRRGQAGATVCVIPRLRDT